ncbi:DUF2127 domain-containing protein [Bordetella genomosp. 11]|uniref:DUF2127 domain-containing protein n=1 Tax=Bordetella genomosp. 11 TaxID=1416808 RepID=A0A261UZV1_9BORD|nr:DUF2127 domain-containing protein [Bordetella genomosp. 11]OZI66443.1 hypothetical protein CAL28_01505 [Bordetella genomosp. 11]
MSDRDPVLDSAPAGRLSARQRAQRLIALVEAAKGVGALAASIGLLSLLHHDLRRIVAVLIGHFGLDPGGHYPEELLHFATVLQDTSLRTLVALASCYVILRLAEAYGLWRDRIWGEWLGALSGAIYVPFEVHHLIHRPGALAVAVVLFNVAIVAFLAWQLWHRRQPAALVRR